VCVFDVAQRQAGCKTVAFGDDLLEDVAQFHGRLRSEADLKTAIASLLSPLEVAALRRRAAAPLAERCYPMPTPGERNFPWPPV
jgi:hypothetical protein